MNRYQGPASAAAQPDLTDGELHAIKALQAGKASPNQQQMALATIVYKFASVGDWPFRPDTMGGERDTNIMLGRQRVGLLIQEAITRPMAPVPQPEGVKNARPSTPADPDTGKGRRNPKPAKPATE